MNETTHTAHFELHFRDRRPPHEILYQLEAKLRAPLAADGEGSKLIFRGTTRVPGGTYRVELSFDAALLLTNCYTFRVNATTKKLPAAQFDYFRNSAESWLNFWKLMLRLLQP